MNDKASDLSGPALVPGVGERMVWVDLEMTGLDLAKDHIIEMACIVTDGELNIVAEGPDIVIHQSDEIMANMNAWCIEHHGASGLTDRVRQSKYSLQETEDIMLKFVKQHTLPKQAVLCGNSIFMDKAFMMKYMPRFMAHLHYRIVDVSTVKELSQRWYPEEHEHRPKKSNAHRALSDILESIDELRFYRGHIFKTPKAPASEPKKP
eukprot:CAMPEP_0184651442 /NCGR_PEP_ID=MMETSP0308-20130426/9050_1 /TAXON_ID=38269 /ORGANISM="Gloeochaete witrockiana, Strain SAG 46.84" /LENGTH=206 /DNA_ID=CAMNT_0027085659 /DNA_START=139 /DNA_END=759 /DNA_ORIENTATION=-